MLAYFRHHLMGAPVSLASPRPGRELWVDRAKAISILLVVANHLGGDYLFLSLFKAIRMPLFFFVAGFFCVKALHKPWSEFLSTRVAHFLYLYVLWSTITLVILQIPRSLLDDQPWPFERFLQLFWQPPDTLWFIYALAIMFFLAKLTHRIPAAILLPALIVLFFFTSDPKWPVIAPLMEKVARLAPYFVLGALTFPLISRNIDRLARFWPIAAIAYFPLAYLLYTGGNDNNLVFLLASLIGIAFICGLTYVIEDRAAGKVLDFIGSRTIMIYVLHQPILWYSKKVLGFRGIVPWDLVNLGAWLAAIIGGIVIGMFLNNFAPWLFTAPWTLRRKPPADKLATAKS